MRRRPPRTLKRKAALATIRELRSTLQYIAEQLARTDLAAAKRLQFIELQLRTAAKVARLGATVSES